MDRNGNYSVNIFYIQYTNKNKIMATEDRSIDNSRGDKFVK